MTFNTQAQWFTGVYRVIGNITAFSKSGSPVIRIRLCNAYEELVVELSTCEFDVLIPDGLHHLQLIQVMGYMTEEEVLLTNLDSVGLKDLMRTQVLSTMPRALCADPTELGQLIQDVSNLSTSYLITFVRLVLEQRNVVELFLRVPASGNHHHSGPMGLLKHSRQVANNVVKLAEMNEPSMPTVLKEIGFVAGLLHDVGKVKTFDRNGRYHQNSILIAHDYLTLEICSRGLEWLESVVPDAASALRHIWCSASPGARYGVKPLMSLARYVRDADGMSAISDHEVSVFQRSGRDSGYVSAGRIRYWKPQLESNGLNYFQGDPTKKFIPKRLS